VTAVLRGVRDQLLAQVPEGVYRDGVAAAVTSVFSVLRTRGTQLIWIGAILAVVCYLFGPGRGAVWLRRQVRRGAVAGGRATARGGRWLGANAPGWVARAPRRAAGGRPGGRRRPGVAAVVVDVAARRADSRGRVRGGGDADRPDRHPHSARPHLGTGGAHMKERYEIRIHGLIGPLLRSTFEDLACERLPAQSTIRGKLTAEELHRLLRRLDQSGIQLVYLDSC
jgi:hypothetical protein